MPRSTPPVSPPVHEGLRPYVFFLTVVWLGVFALFLFSRRRTAHVDRIVWDGSPQLQQPRTVDLDGAGVTITDVLSRTEYQWSIFRGFEETRHLFVLLVSDYSFQALPKRAFRGATEEELRQLLRAHAQGPTRAFPVLPATQQQPTHGNA